MRFRQENSRSIRIWQIFGKRSGSYKHRFIKKQKAPEIGTDNGILGIQANACKDFVMQQQMHHVFMMGET